MHNKLGKSCLSPLFFFFFFAGASGRERRIIGQSVGKADDKPGIIQKLWSLVKHGRKEKKKKKKKSKGALL
jgi:hypothetical protein